MSPGDPSSREPIRPVVPDYRLLRVIGEGSYGQVWLGRSVTGTYRAIKIVSRDEDHGARAFTRAFKGLHYYEPISRLDESLMDVLHVGPAEPGSYFYCVMELADPAPETPVGPAEAFAAPADARFDLLPINPDTYAPLTLRLVLEQHGRLPVAESVELGITLCRALGVLHKRHLVHRDVKPSNIILAQGRPKLADIDLVTPPDATLTQIVAEGYTPQEGAGTAPADLYSLGKVLYEASTGSDRTDFPLPPLDLPPNEQPMWADLNEVLMRACAESPKDRYASAQELLDDLLLVRAGRSPQRLRSLERRYRVGIRAALALLVAGLLAGFAFLREHRHAREHEALARQNRDQAVRLHLSEGFRRLDERDLTGAAPFFVAAGALEESDPVRAAIHALRVRMVLDECSPLVALGAHDGAIMSAQFSRDGTRILTASLDQTARVWDASTGEPVSPPLRHDGMVNAASFSPDDQQVLTMSEDGSVRLWGSVSGMVLRTLCSGTKPATCGAFSLGGKRAAAGFADGSVSIWETTTGRLVGNPSHSDRVYAIAASADGRFFATASEDGTARVWSAETGWPSSPVLAHEKGNAVRIAAFNPSGSLLATGGGDATARLWELPSGRPVCPPIRHRGTVWTVAFSADGLQLLTGGGQYRHTGEARLWRVPTGERLGEILSHRMPISAALFHPHHARIVTASVDGLAQVWDAATLEPLGPLYRHESSIRSASFDPSGDRLLTASRDGTWRVSSLGPPRVAGPVFRFPTGFPDVTRVFGARPWVIARDGPGGGAYLCDGRTMTNITRLTTSPMQAWVKVSPSGRWGAVTTPAGRQWTTALLDAGATEQPPIVSVVEDFQLQAFSPDDRRALASVHSILRLVPLNLDSRSRSDSPLAATAADARSSVPLEFEAEVRDASFSSDGRWVAAGGADQPRHGGGAARIWRANTGMPQTPLLSFSGPVNSLAFSPDNRWLAIAVGSDELDPERAHILDVASGSNLGPGLPHPDGVNMVLFSPDGKMVLTACDDGIVRMWDAVTQEPRLRELRHDRGIQSFEYSPDGRLIATGSMDGTARLWDSATGDPVAAPLRHGGPVDAARFYPDGTALVTSSRDGALRVWRLPVQAGDRHALERKAAVYSGLRVVVGGETVAMPAAEHARLFLEMRRAEAR